MKKAILLIIVLLLFFTCGCTGYREIDRGYIVTAIGVSQKDNRTNIFIEAVLSSNVVDNPPERVVLLSTGNDINTAFKNFETQLVKPLYFEQTGAVVVDNSLGEENRKELFDFCKNHSAIGLGIYIVLTNDLNLLFNFDSPNGVLGYDIIGLINNYEKSNSQKLYNRLFELQRQNFSAYLLPTVTTLDGNLILKAVSK